jgi:hypothetical protein
MGIMMLRLMQLRLSLGLFAAGILSLSIAFAWAFTKEVVSPGADGSHQTAFAYRGLIAMLTRLRVPATVALRRPRRRRRHLHGLRGRGRGAVGAFGATVSGAVWASAA